MPLVDLSMHLTFGNFFGGPTGKFKQERQLTVDGFRATGICLLNKHDLFDADFV
jgi:hypothetical protein